ncbi:hypothetical protein [Parafrankia discariae]|uniref:hypothetical protein n=1 Tax=Parafrankia discariae TaxID=365528 RepID=UPI00036EF8C8|nr:hypothetical protein [Parafrankia discariae]
MPARRSVRASLLWAALLAVLGLVGATPNALSQAAAGVSWPTGVAAVAPAAAATDGSASPAALDGPPSPGALTSASTAVAQIPTDLARARFDGRPPMVGPQQRSDQQLLSLGTALGVLTVGAAWLSPGRRSAGRARSARRGGPGPRAPPRSPARA